MLIGEGGRQDINALELSTRRKQHILNAMSPERSDEELRAATRIWQERFPQIEPRSSSGRYNCMGMVFAARRTAIDIDQLDMILRDDEYRPVSSLDLAKEGDVVVYGQGPGIRRHVGIVLRTENVFGNKFVYILSQWGYDGEYIHRQDEVPEMYGRIMEIWTDRRSI